MVQCVNMVFHVDVWKRRLTWERTVTLILEKQVRKTHLDNLPHQRARHYGETRKIGGTMSLAQVALAIVPLLPTLRAEWLPKMQDLQ